MYSCAAVRPSCDHTRPIINMHVELTITNIKSINRKNSVK